MISFSLYLAGNGNGSTIESSKKAKVAGEKVVHTTNVVQILGGCGSSSKNFLTNDRPPTFGLKLASGQQ